MTAREDRDLEATRTQIEAWLRTQLPEAQGVALSELRAASGGLSSETLFCGVSWSENGATHAKRLVLRIRPDGHHVIPDPDLMLQYEIMRRLEERSVVPVPAVWLAEPEGSVIGTPFFFMEELAGSILLPSAPQPANPTTESTGPSWSPEDLDQIYDNALDVLATLHKADWHDGFEFVGWPGQTALDGTINQVKRWYEVAKRGRNLGVIDVGMNWVLEHQPASTDCCLCWGDARPGNLVIADDLSIAGVLDWEMAVLGPPEADFGWWLMFEEVAFNGFTSSRPDGVPDREETIAKYEKRLGRPVEDIHYYEILAAFRLAVINVRLLELGAYGPLSEGWILEDTDERMVINDPFTRLLARWLDLDVSGVPADAVS
jgi:aminoglycoside phosphotransferase (APT) family kinase protein